MSADDRNNTDHFMELAAGAMAIKRLYDAYVAAGFTQEQSLWLVGQLLTEGMKVARKG
jgi:hypothetical protein